MIYHFLHEDIGVTCYNHNFPIRVMTLRYHSLLHHDPEHLQRKRDDKCADGFALGDNYAFYVTFCRHM